MLHCRRLFEFHKGAILRGLSSPSTSPQAEKHHRCCSGTQSLEVEQWSSQTSDRKRPSWTGGSDCSFLKERYLHLRLEPIWFVLCFAPVCGDLGLFKLGRTGASGHLVFRMISRLAIFCLGIQSSPRILESWKKEAWTRVEILFRRPHFMAISVALMMYNFTCF
jgi:hypothetical protein